jgi:hypothetical protein
MSIIADEAMRVVDAAREEARTLVKWKEEMQGDEKARAEYEKANSGTVQLLTDDATLTGGSRGASPVGGKAATAESKAMAAFGGGGGGGKRNSASNMIFALKASARDTRNAKVDVMTHKQLVVQQIRNKLAAKVEIKMAQLAERARLTKLKRNFGWAAKRECRITMQQWLALLAEARLLRSGADPGHMQELVGHGHSHNHGTTQAKAEQAGATAAAAGGSAGSGVGAAGSVGGVDSGGSDASTVQMPVGKGDFRNSWSVSLQEASHVFAVSKLITVDEDCSPDTSSLNFVDFLEAICRLADLLSLPNSLGHQVGACKRKCREMERAKAEAALAKERWVEEKREGVKREAMRVEKEKEEREAAMEKRGAALLQMQTESKQWFTEAEAARGDEKQHELTMSRAASKDGFSLGSSMGSGYSPTSPTNPLNAFSPTKGADGSRRRSSAVVLSELASAAGSMADQAGLVDPLKVQAQMIALSSGKAVAKAVGAMTTAAKNWARKIQTMEAEVAELSAMLVQVKKGKIPNSVGGAIAKAGGKSGSKSAGTMSAVAKLRGTLSRKAKGKSKAAPVPTMAAFTNPARQNEEVKRLMASVSLLQRRMASMRQQAEAEAKVQRGMVTEQEHARDAATKWVQYRMEEERQFIKKRREDFAQGDHAPVVASNDVDSRLKTATNLQTIEVISTILHLQRSYRRRKQQRVNAEAEARSRANPILQADGTFMKTAMVARKAMRAFNKLAKHNKDPEEAPSPTPDGAGSAAAAAGGEDESRKLSMGGNDAVLTQSIGQSSGEDPAIGAAGGQIVTVICPPGPLGMLLVSTGTGEPAWNKAPRMAWQPAYVRLEGFSSEIAKVQFTRAQVAMLAAAIPLRSYLLTVDKVDVHKSTPESVQEYLHYRAAEPRTLRFEMPVERGGVEYWKPPEEMRMAIMADMNGETEEQNRAMEQRRRTKSSAGRRRALMRSVMVVDKGSDEEGEDGEEGGKGGGGGEEEEEEEGFTVGEKKRKNRIIGGWMKATTGLKKEALMNKAETTRAKQEAEMKKREAVEEARRSTGRGEWWQEKTPPLAVFDSAIEEALVEEERAEEQQWRQEHGVAEPAASTKSGRSSSRYDGKQAVSASTRVAGPALVRYEDAVEAAEGELMGQQWQREELDGMGVFKLVVALNRDPRVRSHANGRWAACDAAYMAYQAALAALEQAAMAERSLLYIQLDGSKDKWTADGKQRRPDSPAAGGTAAFCVGGVGGMSGRLSPSGLRPGSPTAGHRTPTHTQHRFFGGAADSRNDYADHKPDAAAKSRSARGRVGAAWDTAETVSYAPSSVGKPPLVELLRRLLPLLYARLAVEPETSPTLKAAIPGRNARREYLRKGPMRGLHICMYGEKGSAGAGGGGGNGSSCDEEEDES